MIRIELTKRNKGFCARLIENPSGPDKHVVGEDPLVILNELIKQIEPHRISESDSLDWLLNKLKADQKTCKCGEEATWFSGTQLYCKKCIDHELFERRKNGSNSSILFAQTILPISFVEEQPKQLRSTY